MNKKIRKLLITVLMLSSLLRCSALNSQNSDLIPQTISSSSKKKKDPRKVYYIGKIAVTGLVGAVLCSLFGERSKSNNKIGAAQEDVSDRGEDKSNIKSKHIILNDNNKKDINRYIGDNNISEKIKKDLDSKCKYLVYKIDDRKKTLQTTWEGLCFLLGDTNAINYVEENYPEWRTRLSKNSGYGRWRDNTYEKYALMSMAYSLRLAKSENYQADDKSNNELLTRNNIKSPLLWPQSSNFNDRLKKIIIEDEDILRSAEKHFDDLNLKDKKIGFLNAGDPYDPNGFLPNYGNALEEYLSMSTTLVRDLSHKFFRCWNKNEDKFYTTRKNFPPIRDWNEYTPNNIVIERLRSEGRDFYHERGIISKNVHLIRSPGNNMSYNYNKDKKFVWKYPSDNLSNFDVSSNKLGNKTFYVLSIAGLEDRTSELVNKNNHPGSIIYNLWKEIMEKQCRFVLDAFIHEGIKVPFLSAFGTGCFGGNPDMLAEIFMRLLVKEGYADYFDAVVFPIIGLPLTSFKTQKKLLQST